MGKKLFSALMFLFLVSSAFAITCNVRNSDCIGDEVEMFTMSQEDNAHVSIDPANPYAWKVCCTDPEMVIGSACSGTFAPLFSVSTITDGHIATYDKDAGGYDNIQCISASNIMQCEFQNVTSTPGHTCLNTNDSLIIYSSGITNAHAYANWVDEGTTHALCCFQGIRDKWAITAVTPVDEDDNPAPAFYINPANGYPDSVNVQVTVKNLAHEEDLADLSIKVIDVSTGLTVTDSDLDETRSIQGYDSEVFEFDLPQEQFSKGAYEIQAIVAVATIPLYGKENARNNTYSKTMVVTEPFQEITVPDIDLALIPLVALSVLGIIFLSRK